FIHSMLRIDKRTLVQGFCRYLNSNRVMENVIPKYHPGWCATGVIVSTTNDIVQFYEDIFSEKLINLEQLDNLRKLVPAGQAPFFKKPCYGLGVMIDPESDQGEKIGHGGDCHGYNTWVFQFINIDGSNINIGS